jgi:hypothetical protein
MERNSAAPVHVAASTLTVNISTMKRRLLLALAWWVLHMTPASAAPWLETTHRMKGIRFATIMLVLSHFKPLPVVRQ